MCQTGIKASLIPLLTEVCENLDFIDVRLWQRAPEVRVLSSPLNFECIGMKGLPGRPGIGIGHHSERGAWNADTGLSWLTGWIGKDVEAYRSLA